MQHKNEDYALKTTCLCINMKSSMYLPGFPINPKSPSEGVVKNLSIEAGFI